MGKTRAEYQKAYRERKKKTDDHFLVRERARMKQYRVPVSELSKKKRKIVRERNKLYSKVYRAKKRLESNAEPRVSVSESLTSDQSNAVSSSTDVPSTSTENCSIRSHPSSPLLVRLSFPKKQVNRRRSNALRRARSTIASLKTKLTTTNRNLQKWRKKCQRLSSTARLPVAVNPDVEVVCPGEERTPSTRTRVELHQSGVSPSTLPKSVVRKLTMANVLIDEIKHTRQSNSDERSTKTLASVIGGKVMKKYKCMTQIHQATGLSKRKLRRVKSKVIKLQGRSRLTLVREQLKRKVVSFLERDDISICMPGKNDGKKFEREKRQTRTLNDYLSNIFQKFTAENPDTHISFSSFCKMRPRYILLTSFISRNTCLCNKHQCMAMKLKCLRSHGLDVSTSPDSAAKDIKVEDMKVLLEMISDDTVEFEQWSRVEIDGKKRMKVLKVTKSRSDFITLMQNEYLDFLGHVGRVKAQYAALHQLKATLPKGHIILQMDFAENFICANMDEIQSAYWNSTNVTLHPVVAYYMTENLEHKNFVFVSDVNQHNATAVITILKKLIPELVNSFPDATYIHYWTDSPSSQYRNRYMFDIVFRHKDVFGVEGRWNFFECGHGKGPCDGIGGCTKRQASDAIKQGKVIIQDARDFFEWATVSQKSINYRFYSSEEVQITAQELSESTAKPVPGTMKLHAIVKVNGALFSRDISCYCTDCLWGTNLCSNWQRHAVGNGTLSTPDPTPDSPSDPTPDSTSDLPNLNPDPQVAAVAFVPSVDRYVAAIYDDKWYIGKVLEVDLYDGDAKIAFMQQTKGKSKSLSFKWPAQSDELWVDFKDILTYISDPVPMGKSQRQYSILEDDLNKIKSQIK